MESLFINMTEAGIESGFLAFSAVSFCGAIVVAVVRPRS